MSRTKQARLRRVKNIKLVKPCVYFNNPLYRYAKEIANKSKKKARTKQ